MLARQESEKHTTMSADNVQFDVAPEVLALGLKIRTFVIRGLRNRAADSEFTRLQNDVLAEILPALSPESIAADPVLAGFRQLHEAAKVSNRKNISAPENLLEFLAKFHKLPQVNLAVDIYNLVSVETHLALGAHDAVHINGNVHLRFTTGQEKFWPIGAAEPKSVKAGEYSYIDDANDVLCRLEVRQVEKTKVTLETTDVFYIVQGNAATDDAALQTAAARVSELTTRFCGGAVIGF